MSDNKIIIDWLAFTTSISSPTDLISLLGMDGVVFADTFGARGWRRRLYFDCISIHYDGHDGLCWLEMSGQGCRAFESIGHGNYDVLFKYILDNPGQVNVTRLDVAYDDFDGLLDMDKLVDDTLHGNFVSRARKWKCELSSDGVSITHGRKKSDILIRIYDKAAERGRSDEISHWVRCEIMLKHARAFEFIRLLMPEYDVVYRGLKPTLVLVREGENIDRLYFWFLIIIYVILIRHRLIVTDGVQLLQIIGRGFVHLLLMIVYRFGLSLVWIITL